MARKKKGPKVPGYLHHKASGRAFVILAGRRVYLGAHGSPESKQKYERVIAEFLANGRQSRHDADGDTGPLVIEVIVAYWKHAKTYYRREDGTPTGEAERNIRYALRPVRSLYGDTPARDFGPACLEAVRTHMVSEGLSRNVVNQRVSAIRRMFRWAESKEMVPSGTFHSLATLGSLRAGRTEARETDGVAPVEWQHVRATLEHLPDHVAAMVRLQWETAMRPGEVVQMRARDIDRTDPEVWIYRPEQHKNRHRGKDRIIPLLTRCQAILQPFLECVPVAHDSSRFLFAPEGHTAKHERYNTTNYAQAIRRAIAAANSEERHAAILAAVLPLVPDEADSRVEKVVHRLTSQLTPKRLETSLLRVVGKLGIDTQTVVQAALSSLSDHEDTVPIWSPNQLRHAAATRIERSLSVEDARLVLQHADAKTTRRYIQPDVQRAIDSLRRLG